LNEVYAGILNIIDIPVDGLTSDSTPVTDFVRLTLDQISSILNLLIAFGTDNPVVETVRGILMGE